jgi:hypothetical protein
MTTICLYTHCKNTKGHEDTVILSHLIKFGFVKDYTVWTFHDESASVASSSSGGGNSSTTMNAGGPLAGTTVDDNKGYKRAEWSLARLGSVIQRATK